MAEKEALGVIVNKLCGHCEKLLASDGVKSMVDNGELSVLDSDNDAVRRIMIALDIDAVPTFIQLHGFEDRIEVCKLDDDFNPISCIEVRRDGDRTRRE